MMFDDDDNSEVIIGVFFSFFQPFNIQIHRVCVNKVHNDVIFA